MKILFVFMNITRAYLYYPMFIGAFLWLYFKGAHWGFGLTVILLMLSFDPLWRILGRNFWNHLQNLLKK